MRVLDQPGLRGRRARILAPAGVAAAIALVLGGCSSSATTGSTTTTSTGGGGSKSTSTAPKSATPPAGSTTTTAAPPASTTTTAANTTCQTKQLQAVPEPGTGAAGTIEFSVKFTNVSTATCTLFGYPGMQLIGAGGANLPTNVVRGGGAAFLTPAANQPPAQVSLAPNAVASFSLSYSDVPVGGETSCPTSTKAEVTPPNDTGTLPLTLQIAPCGGGTVHVSPVYADAG